MMATIFNSSILNSAILDSAILHKALTQTSSIWLKLIHSDSTWWWQPSWILPSWIQPFCTKKNFNLTQTSSFSLNLMISAILNSAMLDWDTAILDSNILLIFSQIDSKTVISILTIWFKQLHKINFNDGNHFNSSISAILHKTLTQTTSIFKLIHSHSTWWWQPSWILPCWIQTLPSWIQTPCYLLSDSLKNTLPPLWLWLKLIPSD